MKKKRILIIVCDPFLFRFILASQSKKQLSLIATTKMRFYTSQFETSIVDFLLQALSQWGEEIGISLVKESIVITRQTAKQGVSDVYIISSIKDNSLSSITKNVMFLKEKITRCGAEQILKRFHFSNLLTVNIDEKSTQLAQYSKKGKSMSVVSEEKSFKAEEVARTQEFLAELETHRHLGDLSLIRNLACDITKVPVMNVKSQNSVLEEYIINSIRFKDFENLRKLNLHSQENADLRGNILVVSGSRSRLINNIPLILLSFLTSLNILGNYLIFFDKFGLFSYLQRMGNKGLKEILVPKLLLEYWGALVMAKADKQGKFGDIVADVEINDGDSRRQMIPMFGKITTFQFSDRGKVAIKMREGYSLHGGSRNLNLIDLSGNLVIDARTRPIETSYKGMNQSELLQGWIRGTGSVIS